MGIDSDSDIPANLQIGPTSLGMVRIYVEAEEIAEELRAAAQAAREMSAPRGKPRKR